nr:MAG TPA: hypothetical protein [Caudoviricetes sp.]
MRYRCPVMGDLSKRRRRSGEVLKQGRAAVPHQPHKRARKREKLSTHKLWPQRRTVNPQKQCAADEKARRGVAPK